MESNTLYVNVGCARGLYLKNHNTLDVSASVTLAGKGSTRSRATTEVVRTEGDCKWDEKFEFNLNEKSEKLQIAVNHKTRIGSSDLIGKCEIPLDKARSLGSYTWYPLKKKSGDEKYRGEIQLQFEFVCENRGLSISSMSLNKIEKDSVFDKMKRKMNKLTHHKKAEDTMSMASGFSAVSMKSSHSNNRILNKLNKTFGGLHKSSTLPSNANSFGGDSDMESSNPFDSPPHFLSPPSNHIKRNSFGGGFEVQNGSTHSLSIQATGPVASSTPLHVSPAVSTAESFHVERANSIRSVGSSGFGSSKYPSNQKLRDPDANYSNQDLIRQLDSLRLELQVKNTRLRDMQDYMDNLIMRVMDRCPDILAAPAGAKQKHRFY